MLFLSLKHLLSRKKQTGLILFGIVLGTAAYVVISGMMLGFQTYILDRLVNNQAHIRISAKEEYVTTKEMQKIFYPNNENIIWKIPPSGRKDSAELQTQNFGLKNLKKLLKFMPTHQNFLLKLFFVEIKQTLADKSPVQSQR